MNQNIIRHTSVGPIYIGPICIYFQVILYLAIIWSAFCDFKVLPVVHLNPN